MLISFFLCVFFPPPILHLGYFDAQSSASPVTLYMKTDREQRDTHVRSARSDPHDGKPARGETDGRMHERERRQEKMCPKRNAHYADVFRDGT